MELIDKAAVIAVIEKQGTIQPQLSWFTDKLIQTINSSVEVKEMDLEKEMSEYFVEHPNEFFSDKYKLFAKHFYELGLKAKKGE